MVRFFSTRFLIMIFRMLLLANPINYLNQQGKIRELNSIAGETHSISVGLPIFPVETIYPLISIICNGKLVISPSAVSWKFLQKLDGKCKLRESCRLIKISVLMSLPPKIGRIISSSYHANKHTPTIDTTSQRTEE